MSARRESNSAVLRPTGLPDDRRAQLRRAVQRDELRLRQALHGLNHVVTQRADVRENIAGRPYLWLTGGFLVGLWWGARR